MYPKAIDLTAYTAEQIHRYALGAFISSCYSEGLTNTIRNPRVLPCQAVRISANRIAEEILKASGMKAGGRTLCELSDLVIKWAAGDSAQSDIIEQYAILSNSTKFEYCAPLMYLIGDRSLETSKPVMNACSEWIKEM